MLGLVWLGTRVQGRTVVVLGVLKPFRNKAHTANSVYFETVFAYFVAVV